MRIVADVASVSVERLDRVREIRNKVMHFSPEAVRDEKARGLMAFIKFIKGLDRCV